MTVKILSSISRGEMAEAANTFTEEDTGSCGEECEEVQISTEESMVAFGELKTLLSSRFSSNTTKSTTLVDISRKTESAVVPTEKRPSPVSHQIESANDDMTDQHRDSSHSETKILLKRSTESQGTL